MSTIPQVAQEMQEVLTTFADATARPTGFVQRASKMTGPKFAQTLVFGWMGKPDASLEELTQTAAALEVEISPQGLDERFTPAAARFLQGLLDRAVRQLVSADPVAISVLQRFQGVYILDGSVIRLPDELASVWPGCGGRLPKNTSAALKIVVRLDVSTGALYGPCLQEGRRHDRSSPLQREPLPRGALRLADLGFFSLDQFQAMSQQGVYWLSRLQAGTAVFDAAGERQDLVRLLQAQGPTVDLPIQVGVNHHLPCRLLAVRVPEDVANRRRQKLRKEARKKGQAPSKIRMALADWTIYITSAPAELLSLQEALVLARVRWQIELLFRLWKEHGQIDEWRTQNPWRILCEIYAKLLVMLIQHWIFLVSCWGYPDRSLRKAAKTVQKHAICLACSFDSFDGLCRAIAKIQRCLARGCRINKRRKEPHTYQLLQELCEGGLT